MKYYCIDCKCDYVPFSNPTGREWQLGNFKKVEVRAGLMCPKCRKTTDIVTKNITKRIG